MKTTIRRTLALLLMLAMLLSLAACGKTKPAAETPAAEGETQNA